MTLRFSHHIFHTDQFGHARAFRTQIDLNKKINADQFGYEKHDPIFNLILKRNTWKK
jgi:hypothetical protein